MNNTTSTQYALFVLRSSIFILMIIWAARKIVTDDYVAIFQNFYSLELGLTTVYIIGGLQIAILLAFLAGMLKFYTYGAVAIMNLVTLVVSLPALFAGNLLFAGIFPIFGASLALFLMRDHDTWLAVQKSDRAVPQAS